MVGSRRACCGLLKDVVIASEVVTIWVEEEKAIAPELPAI